MNSVSREFLLARARQRCEYCHVPAKRVSLGIHIEHIISRQHGGADGQDNLAIACAHCNLLKGPNIASLDPETGKLSRLFHPRRDKWDQHFKVIRNLLVGTTPIGRATVTLLDLNNPSMIEKRRFLRRLGIRF
jgi:hypothetical protein